MWLPIVTIYSMAAAQVACRPLMQPYTIYCYTAYHVLPVYFAALSNNN